MIKNFYQKTIGLVFLYCFLLSPAVLFAQVKPDSSATTVTTEVISPLITTTTIERHWMHGSFYVTWGYNLDAYTRSTVNFKDKSTDDYDFTLHKAMAHDKPDFSHLLTTPISVPQYQFNIGYFFNNKHDLGVEFAWNHLKYVMDDNQTVHLTGYIRGTYYDQDTLVTPDFVHLEHTNGNNYGVISIVKRWKLWDSKNSLHHFSVLNKLGGGLLVPKTDSYIMGMHNDGPFRVSGFVVTFNTQLRFDFFRYLFIETGFQGAVADYTNVKLAKDGRAKHSFLSIQALLSAGINIPLSK